MMSLLGRGLSLVWEAPQTALGAAMLGAEAARKRIVQIEVEDGRLVVQSRGTGISLGYIVFWSRENSRWHDLDARNRAHELGHTKQSRCSAGSTCRSSACRLSRVQPSPLCFAK